MLSENIYSIATGVWGVWWLCWVWGGFFAIASGKVQKLNIYLFIFLIKEHITNKSIHLN